MTEAIVLNKEPQREHDARYSLFTKRFGKMVGKATSARKITSKLAGHLEPGNLVRARFVEKGGTQLVDALKYARIGASPVDLRLLHGILHEGEQDLALWNELTAGTFSWRNILRILGWDPAAAACELCGKPASHFYTFRQEFFCPSCASKFNQNELLSIAHGQV